MTDFPAADYLSDSARTEGQYKTAEETILSGIKSLLGASGYTELTISSGSITPVEEYSCYNVDTESDDPTDNLDRLNSVNVRDGQIVALCGADAARVTTVRSDQLGSDQIFLFSGDYDLTPEALLVLQYVASLDGWKEFARLESGVLKAPGLQPTAELTVTSDAITPTQFAHKLQPQSSTSDDLAQIAAVAGINLLLLRTADTGDSITLKHNTGSSPKIITRDGADILLDLVTKFAFLEYRGTDWYEIARFGFDELLAKTLGPINTGRLTFSSGVKIPTSDLTAQGTVYWAGEFITLPDGAGTGRYKTIKPSGVSLALSGTAGEIKAIYGRLDSAGTNMELSLGAAWTNTTTRSETLDTDSVTGYKVLSTDHAKVWLGDVYFTGSNVSEWTSAHKPLFNAFNRVFVTVKAEDTGSSFTYNSSSYQEFRGGTTLGTSRVGLLIGEDVEPVQAVCQMRASHSNAGTSASAGIGLDSGTALASVASEGNSNFHANNSTHQFFSHLNGLLGLGYHTLRAIQKGNGSATCTWAPNANMLRATARI